MTGAAINIQTRPGFIEGVVLQLNIQNYLLTKGYQIDERDIGCATLSSGYSCGLIHQCLYLAPGAYIEIGSRFGGSAAVASALADWVVAIDPYYMDEFNTTMKELEIKKATKITKFSKDVKRLPKHKYTVGYIDGDHSYDSIISDFDLLKNRVSHYIIFDDFDQKDVYNAVMDICTRTDNKWRLVHASYTSAVLATHNDQEKRLGLM